MYNQKEVSKKYYQENLFKIRERQKKYYLKNKEIISKKHKQYRENNIDKINNLVREWQKNNPNKVFAYSKKHQKKNSAKLIERSKKWDKNNPIKLFAKQRRRRAKINDFYEIFTNEEWETMKNKTKGVCPKCKIYVGVDKITLDHIFPISKAPKGLIYTIKDIQPLCMSCNSSKGAKTI